MLEKEILNSLKIKWVLQLAHEYENICFQYRLPLKKPLLLVEESQSSWGHWDPNKKMMFISQKLILNYSWEVVLSVLKHEMAHQIVSDLDQVSDGHGPFFQKACKRLGLDPQFCKASLSMETTFVHWKFDKTPEEDEILLNKIQKLLNLAQSSNEHEAAVAMTRVQELYEKFNIKKWQLGEKQKFEILTLNFRKKSIPTTHCLACSILQQHFYVTTIFNSLYCPMENTSHKTIEIIGTKQNVLMAEYVFLFLIERIELLWKYYARTKFLSTKFKSSYQRGILDGFLKKLEESKKNREKEHNNEKNHGVALMTLNLIHQKELDDYLQEKHPRIVKNNRSSGSVYTEHFQEGIQEGKKINLHKPISQREKKSQTLLLLSFFACLFLFGKTNISAEETNVTPTPAANQQSEKIQNKKIKVTLKTAMQMAIEHSFSLKAAEANTRSSEYTSSQAVRSILPSLTGSSNATWENDGQLNKNSFHSTNDNLKSSGTLSLNQPILGIIPLIHQKKKSDISLEINEALETNTHIQTALLGAQLFLNYQLAKAKVTIAEANRDTAEKNKQNSQTLYETGSINKDDYLRILLQYTQSKQTLINAQSDLDYAGFSLAQGLGVSAPDEMDIETHEISHWESHHLTLPNLEESKKQALDNNQELLAQRKNIALAEVTKTISQDDYLPSVGAFVNYSRNFNPKNGSTPYTTDSLEGVSYGFQLSWNLWDWGVRSARNDAFTEQIMAQQNKTENQKEITLQNVMNQYNNIVKNLNGLTTADESVKTSKELLDLVSFRFLNGQMTSLDLVTAQQNLTTSKADLAQARFNLDLAWLTFQTILGNNPSFRETVNEKKQ
jgi:outer membrane protein TolC